MWRPDICGGLSQLHDKVPAYVEKDLPATRLGGNSNIFGFFTPKLGEDEPILTNIFQRGLKPPTRQSLSWGNLTAT